MGEAKSKILIIAIMPHEDITAYEEENGYLPKITEELRLHINNEISDKEIQILEVSCRPNMNLVFSDIIKVIKAFNPSSIVIMELDSSIEHIHIKTIYDSVINKNNHNGPVHYIMANIDAAKFANLLEIAKIKVKKEETGKVFLGNFLCFKISEYFKERKIKLICFNHPWTNTYQGFINTMFFIDKMDLYKATEIFIKNI